MKNTSPFDLFGEKKELCFKIKDIRALERALGKPVQLIYSNMIVGVDFCFAAYPILLKISEKEFEEKSEKYLEDGTGSIDKLAGPALAALTITGVIGKPMADKIRAKYYPTEKAQDKESDEKNAEATAN